MNVLVTGASGFLGGHLVRELIADGATVNALARSERAAAAVTQLGAIPVRGDLDDPPSLAAAVTDETQAVFHTAADTSQWRPHRSRQRRINVDGTRTLAEAALIRGASFLHTSSVSSFSHLQHAVLLEDVPRLGAQSHVNYERTKFLGEEAVRDAMRRGLRATIFNPSHILGPGDRQNWSRLFVMVDRGELPGAPPGYGPFADVREIARAQVRAWRAERYGESYLLGGDHASFVELIAHAGKLLGRKTPQRPIPAFALLAYARVLDLASRITRREPNLTPDGATLTCHHLEVDSSKAQRELDYRITPIDALVADTVGWMREVGMLAPTPPTAERADR